MPQGHLPQEHFSRAAVEHCGGCVPNWPTIVLLNSLVTAVHRENYARLSLLGNEGVSRVNSLETEAAMMKQSDLLMIGHAHSRSSS
jgi:hypothetical protein